MKYGYYPGCAAERNARAYHTSAMAATAPFDIQFEEVEDWNCCGATEYISLHKTAAYSLVARNLALASKQAGNGHQLVASCSLCYLNLAKTEEYMRRSPEFSADINTALNAGGLS